MQPLEISAFLHELCKIAELETLPRFRNLSGVDNKRDEGFDPVTEADRNAELAIRNLIAQRFPDHGILGEEFGNHNESAEYCWIIDPIDGTRAFISGVPVWGTLIGLYHNGTPFAGVMHQPFTGEKYLCDGVSSYYQRGSEQVALTTQGKVLLPDAILMSTSPELFSTSEFGAFERVVKRSKMVRYGIDCYAYCQVAAGNIGLVIEAGLHAYDIAALIPIVEKAGGVVSDWQGGSAANGGQIIAAANVNLHTEAIGLLNQN